MEKKKRSLTETGTIFLALLVMALFEIFKTTISFFWEKLLRIFWPDKKKNDKKT
jgi:hypothetical protein